ncbi:MAG TPA: sigma 54-interacting transcriptional regulator [Desulfosalsimonadaceae bacterium]|nr:sigma 54-interacting transcriptional regulator [Desulfosalsimonadaceae bacterium]
MNKSAAVKELFSSPVALHAIIDEIPTGILILDPQRRIITLNHALEALTGFSRQVVRGIGCHHVLRSRICFKHCPLLDMDRHSEAVCQQSDIINKERQLIPVRITMAPVTDFAGNIAGYIESVEDMRAVRDPDAEMHQAFSFSRIIGKSPKMEKIFQMLPLIAQNDSSVLITGETGTGKDMLAEAIHDSSSRAKGPFIKVNCGALPETLLESELFGHRKGAFTGAVENKTGRFRLAQNGTLYLTEIGDLPVTLQVKLLTFLDDKIVYPLGSAKGIHVDVRVIAGTHRNLEEMVQRGQFRDDLLFRLNVVRLHLPPLREREEDKRLLIDHFFNHFTVHFGKSIKGFTSRALELLKTYSYPGNVRELRNIIEYSVNVCQDDRIDMHYLPAYLTETPHEPKPRKEAMEAPQPAQGPSFRTVESAQGKNWTEIEKQMILDALYNAGGRRSKAAELLGWGRSTLWRKMKHYNIS